MSAQSKIFSELVDQLKKLPSIGKKSATRLGLHLVNQDKAVLQDLINALQETKDSLIRCKQCNHISETELCGICSSPTRNNGQICVVENIRDLIAIEETQQYNGKYYVLKGLISPIDGITPSDIELDKLLSVIVDQDMKEVIVAISPTYEGDTTVFYLSKMLADYPITMSTLARGVAFGSELEYTDEITLGRSITARVPYSNIYKETE